MDDQPREHPSPDLFQTSPLLRWIGLLIAVLVFQMATGTTWLMLIPAPRLLLVGLTLLLTLAGEAALAVTRFALKRFGLALPAIQLWACPLSVLGSSYLVLLILLVTLPSWFGRAFWTQLLDLNAKGATVLFTSVISGVLLYLGIYSLVGIIGHLRTIFTTTAHPDKFREHAQRLEEERVRSRKANRTVFWAVLTGLIVACGWIIWFRPETILFYRGQIQLQSRQYNEVALETYSHLARKYPDYRYRDAVDFRIAWILERRLQKFGEAAKAYADFLQQWGKDNIWADDALANLVRISLDKQGDAPMALHWIEIYRQSFPAGHLAPHIELYRVRALRALHRDAEAERVLTSAKERFGGKQLLIYDTEDDLSDRIPFETAAEILAGVPEPPASGAS